MAKKEYRSAVRSRQLIRQTLDAMHFPKEWVNSTFLAIRISFSIGGLVDVCIQWLKGDLDCTLDDILEHIAGIIVRSASDLAILETEKTGVP